MTPELSTDFCVFVNHLGYATTPDVSKVNSVDQQNVIKKALDGIASSARAAGMSLARTEIPYDEILPLNTNNPKASHYFYRMIKGAFEALLDITVKIAEFIHTNPNHKLPADSLTRLVGIEDTVVEAYDETKPKEWPSLSQAPSVIQAKQSVENLGSLNLAAI